MVDWATVSKLGSWSGYRVGRVVWPEHAGGTVEIHLKPTRKWLTCQRCGRRSQQIHETVTRRVRDLPLFEYRVVLVVPRRRLWCDHCGGPRLGQLDWLGRYQRVTDRFAEAICRLLRAMPINAVANFYERGLLGTLNPICTASSPAAGIRCTPACSRASTTPSR